MPAYIFSELSRIKLEAEKKGLALLSLAIGDPDEPTPRAIVEKIEEAAKRPENHGYSPYPGTLSYRQAACRWMEKRFGVSLSAEKETVGLVGSKEGLAHFPLAFCNPGDRVLYPSPGYPIFQTCILLAGGIPVTFSHMEKDAFLPNLTLLEDLLKKHRPKFMILNFPCNPTTATVSREILEDIVALAKKYSTFIAYDNAYGEIYFDSRPPSILEIPGAKELTIEFHSLSKTFNMTGWRVGFAAGNEELIAGLASVKTHIDSGPLLAVQEAAIYALDNSEIFGDPIRALYRDRRDGVLRGLQKLGLEYLEPKSTFYVWVRVPHGGDSMEFAKRLIEQQGLIVTPGIGFGLEGKNFFRLSLTAKPEKLEDAIRRLEAALSQDG